MLAVPFSAMILNLKAFVHEQVCKQAAAPRWLQPVATVVTVHEEVDSMFAHDPGEQDSGGCRVGVGGINYVINVGGQ